MKFWIERKGMEKLHTCQDRKDTLSILNNQLPKDKSNLWSLKFSILSNLLPTLFLIKSNPFLPIDQWLYNGLHFVEV
jgi:hypothetical protein